MTTRHFPGRDVQPYAEPVPEDLLIVGETYFAVHYLDAAMTDPEMEALVYLARNLFEDTPGCYFQDAGSYRAGTRYDQKGQEEPDVHCQASGQVRVMEFERALDCLLYCSLLRKERTRPGAS